MKSRILTSTTNGSTQPGGSIPNGSSQPPRKSVTAMPEITIMFEVLGEQEGDEARAAVLGDVAADQLGVGLDEVERRAVGLGEAGDQEDQEADELRDEVPHARLGMDDRGQRQRARR